MILIRTPYNKAYHRANRRGEARQFASQGYIVAVQDTRGRFASEGEFTVQGGDVYLDGKAYNVQEGIARARYREGFTKKVWMKAGGIYKVEIDLEATSSYFGPGHRIRVEVASSNFPRFDRNLNTGGKNYDETRWIVAENKVHHSARYPSFVLLPVIP